MHAMPGMLAIELSARVGSVALRDLEGRVAERRFEPGDRSREPLLPEIDRLVREASMRPADLRAIGVSTGPGGFTGLRISIAAAKGIAAALGIRTVPVPSALVIAESTSIDDASLHAASSVLTMVASKRGSAWLHRAVCDEHAPGGWRTIGEPSAVSRPEIEASPAWHDLDGTVLLADEHQDPTIVEALCERGALRWSGGTRTPPITAMGCLRLAERLHAAGAAIAPEALLPTYPREPEAVTLWNLRHPQASARSG
ncbi:MAG: tRNA (adenosine(37)-N6)-threonylcarbamoyltransferase complex dimerization subunit type 1 TsaB [Phycisphaerales bacterium]|jgi:tRNA threonylcarbamoyl adenosine modification protein YeaZ